MLGRLCELFVSEAAYKLAQSIVHEPHRWGWDNHYTWNGGPKKNGYLDCPGVAVWHANAAYGLHVEHDGQKWTPNGWDRRYIHSAIQHMKAQRALTAQRTVIDAVTKATS